LVRVDLQGKLGADPGAPLAVPLDGPPTLECGAFVEVPRNRVGLNQTWEVSEDRRPIRTWQVNGTDAVNGTSCIKLVGVQQTDDWDRPRGESTAWRRQDTVWLAPRLGVAYRVERVIEKRETGRRDPSQRSLLRYELETNLQYPGQLYEDRRREILQANSFAETAAPLLTNPARHQAQLEALVNKIGSYAERNPPTPYREAVLQVKRRVEAARRGESPPAVPVDLGPAATQPVTLNRPAPDFVAPDFGNPESARLRRWLGKPIVMVFYSPTSQTGPDLLRFAQSLSDTYRQEVQVLGLAMSDDAERVRKQQAELKLTFPILNGSGLRISYAVDATPKVVVVDREGLVRGTYTGWGRETPTEVKEELKRWLPPNPPPREPEKKR
jgi:peroxiredoxin